MTNWIEVLKDECDKSSQSKVAVVLGKSSGDGFPSATVINQVIKGKYPGRTDRLQALVEGVFMNVTVTCPVVGEIASDHCVEIQSRDFAPVNHQWVKLYKACRSGCQYSKITE